MATAKPSLVDLPPTVPDDAKHAQKAMEATTVLAEVETLMKKKKNAPTPRARQVARFPPPATTTTTTPAHPTAAPGNKDRDRQVVMNYMLDELGMIILIRETICLVTVDMLCMFIFKYMHY